jgi:hypothetical protein
MASGEGTELRKLGTSVIVTEGLLPLWRGNTYQNACKTKIVMDAYLPYQRRECYLAWSDCGRQLAARTARDILLLHTTPWKACPKKEFERG